MKVEAALDGGKKAALRGSPEEIYQLIERATLGDLMSQTVTPGQPAPMLCSRAWIKHRSRVERWKSAAHSAWMAGGALDMVAGAGLLFVF